MACNCLPVFGQYYFDGQNYRYQAPDSLRKKNDWVQQGDIRLRWQPFGLINSFDMNLTLGTEYIYAERKGISADLGYIFASTYGNNGGTASLRPATGGIFRLGHRWYMGKRSPQFIETEAGLKLARYRSEETWVGRGVVAGVPAFQELMIYSSRKEVYTLNVKYGFRVDFGPKSPISMEMLMGLGVRYRNFQPNLPEDAEVIIPRGGFINFNVFDYGSRWMPDFPIWIRVTYKL
jgi:hypothetical protein